jgi:hypothetical protein
MKQLALIINGNNITAPGGIPTGGFSGTGINIVQTAISILFVLGIILALVFVIVSGIQWTMSGGDKQKIQSARNRLMFSIIGLIVISISLFIVQTIIALLFNGGSPGRLGGP